MITLFVPGQELFNEKTEEFITLPPSTITLEHSLVSISKWEAKWKKPFFDKKEKTPKEAEDYIRCMCITKNVPPTVFSFLGKDNLKKIEDYISDPMTATTFSQKEGQSKRSRIITSELIYYWMISDGIPMDCEKWHINRLLTLIRVFDAESNSSKHKMSKNDIYKQNSALNAARRAKSRSRG
jgi:hypothetical protein